MNSIQQSPLKWRSAALLSVVALSIQLISPVFAVARDKEHKTQTPIRHLIVIIGENRTFDHVFATYKPSPGESVWNLLSKGDQWSAYLANPDGNYVTPDNTYCNICNPFQYSTSIMTSPSGRAHNQDTTKLYKAIQNGTLPAVSYVKPDGWLDGHPASSKLNLFEGFVKKIVDGVQASPQLWASTAIIVTFDEGGGYYDSGYIQPLDFFGDGTRIPALVVSPYTKPGHISHTYSDHVSILKFIEANWGLAPLTGRSRDNLHNPVTNPHNPYVPLNRPAIGDLMDLFSFDGHGKQ